MRAIHDSVNHLPSSRLLLDMYRAVPILLLLMPLSLNAQQIMSVPADPRVLEQLVNEVRQLRLAIERTNSISSRLQITLELIQLQQNQVNRISSQLESLRNQIVKSETDQSQASSNLTNLESRMEQEQNPNTQKMLQSEQKYLKSVLEQKSQIVQDERTREGELASSLKIEQAKLGELQGRLDSLQKLIEPPQAK